VSWLSRVERGDTISWLSSAISAPENVFGWWECLNLECATNMAPMHGPTYGHGPIPFMAMALFHSWPWPHSIHGHGAFHSWPWRIPFMAMAHSIHGHSPTLSMAKALSLAHHITAPGKTSPYIRSRIARASPPRRFRANRLNPGIKSYWRWGWFRGVTAVDKGDHGTSYIRICIGHKWGYARIYGGKNGHICAYLWAMYAHIYGPYMRISMGAAMAMNAHIYGAMYTRISIVVVMAM